jgi:hypothetical protein
MPNSRSMITITTARRRIRLHEKGGKEHEMPVHHLLEQILDEYIVAAGLQSGQPLFQSVNSEHAQQMAGHESPRTTKLYDRTKDEITLSEVERIRL